MKHTTRLTAAVAAGLLMFTLTACSDDSDSDAQAKQTAPNGDVFNDADVEFATAMIPHHAQALAMVDMTRGRELSPEVQKLTEDIQAAQGPEIEQMADWLTDWDKPIPETMRDHANAEDDDTSGHDMEGMDHEDTDMPGMMTSEQMDELEGASGPEFEDMWLTMMIEHHEGAIEMAQDEQEDGAFGPATELAEAIERSQQAEIDHMEELLDS
jgi:uncharacterized protein (DUF305 family)